MPIFYVRYLVGLTKAARTVLVFRHYLAPILSVSGFADLQWPGVYVNILCYQYF